MLALILSLTLFAQTPVPLGFHEALERAALVHADVLAAQATLASAQADLNRTEADPLALRLERIRAQHALEAAATSLRAARLRARAGAADALFRALEAQDALDIALLSEALARTTLEANQIRYDAGAITRLDLDGARNALEAAQREREGAASARTLAHNELASLLALEASTLRLETPPDLRGSTPTLESLLPHLGNTPQRQNAARASELAEAELASTDNAFSARVQIDAARERLEAARLALREVERSAGLVLESAHNAALAAEGRLRSAEGNHRAAQESAAAQAVRYGAGSISRIAYEGERISEKRAAANAAAARHAYVKTLMGLETALNTELEVVGE